jgi:hypothetical protein
MGYQACSDEVLYESWEAADCNPKIWDDPRKGELYLIIHALEKKEKEEEGR